MKISARDIPSFLHSPDAQTCALLLYGPDSGLVRERSKAIAARILGPKPDPFNRVEFSAEQIKSDPACLRDELMALSLIGGRRVVTVTGAGEKIASVIEDALAGAKTTTYLIIEAEELSPSSALRQLFEKDSHLAAIACYRDEGRGLEEIIRSTFSGLGLRASQDAMHYLVQHLGNDRAVTASELEKIALFMGADKEVTLDVARALTGDNANDTLDDMCHAVACGKVGDAHALLHCLLHDGAQPVAIVRSLLKHFQRLDIAAAYVGSGISPDQAVAQLRPPVFFKYAPLMKREISTLSARIVNQILNLLLRAEKDLKSTQLSPALLISQAIQQAARMAA